MDAVDTGSGPRLAGEARLARGPGSTRRRRAALALAALALAALALAALALALAARADAYVYWTIPGGPIGRANLDGSGVNQNFITDDGSPYGVAVDGDHIYWTDPFASTIKRANLDGSDVNGRFIRGRSSLGPGLAVDGAHVYFANSEPRVGWIGRANLDGSGVSQNFIATGERAYWVAVDPRGPPHIYWTNFRQWIGRANLDGTGIDRDFIRAGSPEPGDLPRGLAVYGAYVYWTNFTTGAIGRANLGSGGIEKNFITGASDPLGVAVDGRHVYWTNRDTNTIGRANLDGTHVDQRFITTVDSPYGPYGVAVDAGGPPAATRCTGKLASGGYGKLIVPAGATCDGTDAKVWVRDGVRVRQGATFILGHENGPSTGVIRNKVKADASASVQLHFAHVWGGVRIYGGRGQFSTVEDNTIRGGAVTIKGYKGTWFGFIRNDVRGNVRLNNLKMSDPDANEVVSNRIVGNLICRGDSPAPQVGDSHGGPNVVSGKKVGQCAGLR
jgi:virginiamycin B lyase